MRKNDNLISPEEIDREALSESLKSAAKELGLEPRKRKTPEEVAATKAVGSKITFK